MINMENMIFNADNNKQRHAFLITIHQNFTILDKLIEFFDDENFDFYIIVDKKVKKKEIVSYIPKASKIFFLRRININWGGWSQIDATMRLLAQSIQGNYDYYHFLQGSDFPVKTKQYFCEFFLKNNGKQFVSIMPCTNWGWRCRTYHFLVDNRFYRNNKFIQRCDGYISKLANLCFKRNNDIDLFFGSAVFSITNECANYIVERRKEISKRYKHTICADEIFLQTTIAVSPFMKDVYKFEHTCNANLRLVEWSSNPKQGSPIVFFMKDYDRLINAGDDILFARKFAESEDMDIVVALFDKLYDRR